MRFFLVAICLASPILANAARVVLKDGKIYEGRITAEIDGNILLKTNPVLRSKFIPAEAILSVTRDPVPPPVYDPQRYVAFGLRLQGEVHHSDFIEIQPAPALAIDASLRAHPLVELGANLDWAPALSGSFAATDGTTTRSYEAFQLLGGGLWLRCFPVYALKWRVEPFLNVGYSWNHLTPSGSGDVLKGEGLTAGTGLQGPIKKNFFWQAGFLYQKRSYAEIEFLGRDGSVDPHIRSDAYTFYAGLSWHVI